MLGPFLLVLSLSHAQASEPARKITEAEIKAFLNSGSGQYTDVTLCESLDQIYINHLEYHDFIGDGRPQAVVVASTCETGTAGPDVHAVYKRGAYGKLVELPFLNAKGDPPLSNEATENNEKYPLFGNPNYALKVEDGKLVVHFGDTSDREEPVVIWYKWDGA